MTEIERLAAIEDIKILKARYFRSVDLKDWALARSVFADDVECDFRGAATDPATGFNAAPEATAVVLHGIEETMTAFESAGPHFQSVHHGHDPEITVTGPDSASGIWPMFDTLRFSNGPVRELTGYGHYYETYERIDGQWKIKTSQLKRLRVDCVMA